MQTSTEPLQGLSRREAADRSARGLVNRVRRSPLADYFAIVRRNIFTVFNALVAPAALALFFLGGPENPRDALTISGMIVVNTLLGLAQELRAKWHLDRLAILGETRAHILREGELCDLPAGDVVQGDCVRLTAGEPVVADGPVLEAHYLEVDEALLTGEADPVPRRAGEPVLSGSFCVAGEGYYRAEQVGAEAFAQRTAHAARAYRHSASPLQVAINRIVQICTYTAVALVLLYLLLQLLREGSPSAFAAHFPQAELMRRIAATITALVPQGLMLMATLSFTLGAVRLARRGAVVQRLNAVEAMASIDVLCMDKTGTLTTNRLQIERLVIVGALTEDAVRALLRQFASAALDAGSKSLAALRAYLGGTKTEVVDQLPFKSQNRYSAVRVQQEGGQRLLVLGAAEALQPFLETESPTAWEAEWQALTPTGLRLLLFAEAPLSAATPTQFNGFLDGFRLRPLALVALQDELRPEAAAVLTMLAAQGIAFRIISGDNAETVRATVAPLALAAGLPELTGPDSVFGRVSPAQKVQIVVALKEQGHQVAMIGDGVNDVLPIKTAHLGIAMGEGSAAAKTVASLVLETNDFTLLPETLNEGRLIVGNVRRAAKLFLTKNVFALVLILGTLGDTGLAFPFLPRHVTILNFLTIGLPALLILLSRAPVAVSTRTSFLREVGAFVLLRGLTLGVLGLGVLMLSAWLWHEDVQTQQTLLLATLVLSGWWTLWLVLRDGTAERLRWLPLILLPVFLLLMYCPATSKFLALTPLDGRHWLAVCGATLLGSFRAGS